MIQKMGIRFATIKNISNEYKDFPPGCVPCPQGNTPGNPGTFEDIHKEFDKLNPNFFEGASVIIKKVLSNHFYVSHTLAMRSKNPSSQNIINDIKDKELDSGYKFGVGYIGIKKVGYKEKYPILYGDIMTNGNLTANFVHTLGCRLRIKYSTKVKRNSYLNSKATAEYRTDDLTVTATLVDPLLLKQEGVLLLQFLQAITSRIAVGVEIACHKSSLPGGQRTNVAGAFRYNTGFRTLSTTVGQKGVRICYYQKQSQHLQMGVEFQSNFTTHESKSKLIYQLNVVQADLIFKGYVDTEWKVGALFEKKLYPIPEASLFLSAILDHNKQNISVGIGLNIE